MNGYESLGYNIYPHLLTNFSIQYLISRYMRKPSQNSKEDIQSGRTPYTSMTMYVIYMVFHTLEQKLYGFQKIPGTYPSSGKYTAAIDNKATNNTPPGEIPGACAFHRSFLFTSCP